LNSQEVNEMGKQIVVWFFELVTDVLKVWLYLWVIAVIVCYYAGV
jgi:hypothetical protein